MSEEIKPVIIAVIAATPPTIFGVAALIQVLKVHRLINSRMTELLDLTRKQAGSEATLAEQEAERQRVLIKDAAKLKDNSGA